MGLLFCECGSVFLRSDSAALASFTIDTIDNMPTIDNRVEWSESLHFPFFGKCKVAMSQKLSYGTKTLYTKFELDL